MPKSSAATLYYVHDPMCSWCYGFAPVWRQLTSMLPRSVERVSLVGGLARDSDQPMPLELREKLQATWRRIMQQIPRTEFNFDFWTHNVPRRSTYPACRAVICARQLADREEAMTAGIQQAYYREARNPSDAETLIDVAAAIGLERSAFAEKLVSAQLNEDFLEELERVQALGVYGFPSLVIESGPEREFIDVNYMSAQPMLSAIDRFAHRHAC